jgi:hypothetical protein
MALWKALVSSTVTHSDRVRALIQNDADKALIETWLVKRSETNEIARTTITELLRVFCPAGDDTTVFEIE